MAPPAAGPKSPPKIVSSPQELAIQLGQPLSLTCGVQGNPRPTVTWYFNGKDASGLAGFRIVEKGNNVSLEIGRFDVPCFGNYLCVARNELGEAKFTLALDASQADQLGSSGERLEPPDLKNWDFVKKEAGGNLSVEFKCRATGQPPPDVLWYRGARKLRSDADYAVTYEKGDVSFLIKKVNKSSSGEYKCVASNPAGKSTTTARLAVKEQLVGGKVRYIIDDISTAASLNGAPQAQSAQAQTTAGEPGQAQASVAKSAAAAQEGAPQKAKEGAKPPAQDRAAAAAPAAVAAKSAGAGAAGGGGMAATIVEKPAELFGIDGQPQEFRIKVAGDPHPTIQWQKGKFLKIKEGPRYHVTFDEETQEDVMVIKELRPADAGTYKCNVFNPGGSANCAVVLNVKDRKDISEEEVLKILEKTDPKHYEQVALMYGITDFRNLLKHVHIKKKKPAEIVKELEDVEGVEEKEVTFMAEVIINDKDLKVEWEKNLDILTPGQKYKMEHKGNLCMLTIKDLRHDDEGKYKISIGDCASHAMLKVTKAPARFRGLMKGCTVFLHERAEFTVEVSRPDAQLKWFFKGKEIDFTSRRNKDRFALETMGNRRTLVIHKTQFEDMGDYSCSTGDDKSTAKLTVKEERYKFTSELRDCEVSVGGHARFECEVSSPNAVVSWFRNKEELTASEKYQIIKEGLKHVLIIKNVHIEKDRGQYICKTKDGTSNAKLIIREPPPGFVSELKNLKGFFKNNVTLECEVAKEDARVKWYKNGKEINLTRDKTKYECTMKGTRRILIIKNLMWDDTAEYTCEAPGGKTSCTMTVEETPIEFKQQLKDSKAFLKESVTFMCELSTEDTEVHWFLNGVEIKMGGRYQIKKEGLKRFLIINGLTMEDMGEYTIEAGIKQKFKSSAKLAIEAKPVKIEKGLKDVSALDKDPELILEATISELDAEVSWLWNGKPIPKSHFDSGKIKMVTEKKKRKLVITNVSRDDSGEYTLVTPDGKSSCNVSVSDRPVKIKSGLRDVSAREKDTEVFLEAEISIPDGEVTWLWNGQAIPADLLSNGRFQIITDGRKRKLKIKDLEKAYCGEFTLVTNSGESKCKLDISDRLIKIKAGLKNVKATDKDPEVTLEAEVSEPDGEVTWLRNGKPIPEDLLKSGKFQIIADGNKRKLKIKDLGKDDAGEFTLKTNDGTSKCNLDVEDRKIGITSKLKDVNALNKDPEVTLDAEVSENDGEVTWLKDGKPIPKKLLDSGKIQIIANGKKRKLKIKDLGKDDAGEYTLKTNVGTSSCNLGVQDRPVKIKSKLKDVKALNKDPEVTLEAEVSEDDGEVTWLKDGKPIPKELLDSGKVQIIADGKKRKLKIKNLGKDDAGEYTLKTNDGTSSCKLGVEDRPVKIKSGLKDVKAMDKDPEVTLEAEVSEADGAVTWLKNGKPIPQELFDSGKIQIVTDGNKRKLKLKDLDKDDGGEYTLVTNDGKSSCKLNVADRPVNIVSGLRDADVVENSPEAALEAEVSEDDGEVTWLKNGKPIPKNLLDSGKLQIVADGKKRKLVIKNPGKDDAGEYTLVTKDGKSNCKINVTDEPVKITKELQPVKVTEGDKAELACEVHKDGAQVQWLKNGKPLSDKDLANIKVVADGKTHKLIFLDAEPKDTGEYSVKSTGGTSSANVNVKEIPAGFTSSLNGAECEYGEDVTFAVELTKPKAEIKWLLNGKVIDPDRPRGKYEVVADGNKRKLIVKNCNGKDNGEITCVFGDKEATSQLVVNEPVGIKKGLEAGVLKEEEKGKLTVELNREKPGGGDVKWFKNGKEITLGGKYKMQRDGNKCSLLIDPVDLTDNAEFTCMAGDSSTSAKATVDEKPALITSELQVPEVIEGEKAEFVIGLNKGNKLDKIKWFKDGKEVYESSRIQLQQRGNSYVLVLTRAQMEDAGTWSCEIDGSTSQGTFVVNEPPLKITSKLRRVDAIEGEDVKFELEVSRENGEVTWFKDGVEINPAANPDKYEIKVIGLKRVLIVKGCSLGDSGQITVVAEKDKKTAVLNVEKPFQMERVPTFTLPLRDTGFFPGKTIVLTVTVSVHPEPDITWTKNGQEVLPGGRIRFSKDYGRYTLEIVNAQAEDEGEYAVTAVNPFGKDFTSCKVSPKTRGHEEDWYVPLFRRYMVTQEVLEGKDARFECKVNGNPVPEVKWMKGDVEIKDGPRHVITFDGKAAALEVRNVSKEDLGTYTCIITNAAGSQECHADIAFDTGLPERKKKRGARRAAQPEEEIEYRKVTEYELEYDENVNEAGGGKVRKVSEEELHKLFLEVEAEEAERLKLGLTIEEWEIREMERLGLTPDQWNARKRQRMLLMSQFDMEMRMKLGLDMESATMVDGVASGAGFGFGRATQVDVHMHGPREPKFKLPLRDTNFLVGGTLTLSVTVNVHPENQVTWYKNGQEIKVGGRIRTGRDFGRYTLTILDATADDIGEYSCASKNPYGNDKCTCQVTIREHGHEEYFSAPLFRRYMVNCDALEGKDGTFTCKINAKPQAEIRWEREGNEIVSDDRHVIQYDGVTAILTIKGVQKSDLGTFHCTATNCAGSVTCHAELALDRDLPITRGRYRAISRTERREGGSSSFVSLGDVYKFESRRSETRITRESIQVVNGSEE